MRCLADVAASHPPTHAPSASLSLPAPPGTRTRAHLSARIQAGAFVADALSKEAKAEATAAAEAAAAPDAATAAPGADLAFILDCEVGPIER